jgi:Zn-dependent peptidase ImmA (M78 family)
VFNIPLRVRNLIKKHSTCDPLRLAKIMNITIMYGQTPHKANGFWRRILRRKYIGINENLEVEWQVQAVTAHEIAHIVLHPDYKSYSIAGRSFFSDSRKENEADEFAAELISYAYDALPKEYVLDFLKNGWK